MDRSERLAQFRKWVRYFWNRKWRWIAVVVFAVLCGGAFGFLLSYVKEVPEVSRLEQYRPDLISRVYSDSGEVIYEFAGQKRVLVPLNSISEEFKQALVAVEDARFYDHWGVDIMGILRAMLRNFSERGNILKGQGGSTITQQLAKQLFLTPEKTVSRKLKEAVLAVQIELNYSKDQILELYANQVYFGEGVYGVESASRLYFGKSSDEINLEESALLAGLLQRPNYYSPLKHPDRAMRRRNHVLRRMLNEEFISRRTFEKAVEAPVEISGTKPDIDLGSYFVEEVRKKMVEEFGSRALYSEGFQIRTSLNTKMQAWAEDAVREGLRDLDKSYRKYRGALENVSGEYANLDDYSSGERDVDFAEGDIVKGLITRLSSNSATVRIGDRKTDIRLSSVSWTGEKNMHNLFDRGDICLFMVESKTEDKLELSLEQEPEVQAALVAIDPESGAVKALVGGYSFESSKFNCATQALRQTGSAFKPIVYAAALQSGFDLSDRFFDRPTVFVDYYTCELYKPENYSRRYYGTTTLRKALEESRNIVSVDLLNRVGYDLTIDFARDLGIKSNLRPYPSLALGSSEVTLLDLTSAFSVFPNQGVRVMPRFIESIEDNENMRVLANDPLPLKVMEPETAYLMVWALRGVVQRGTGRLAASLSDKAAGKTGTTDDYTDAWFCGFIPRLAVGVWVGRDKKVSLGHGMTGARAALPIWKSFMKKYVDEYGAGEYGRPENIVIVPVDYNSGLRATMESNCRDVIMEVFIRGKEPTTVCSDEVHRFLELDWTKQLQVLERGRAPVDVVSYDETTALSLKKRLVEAVAGEHEDSSVDRRNAARVMGALKRDGEIRVTVISTK